MKKLTLILTLIFIASFTAINSQSLSFGVKGGLSFSNMLEKSDLADFSENYSFIPGYNVGVFAEAQASPDLIGEAGITLGTFGYHFESSGSLASVDTDLKTTFLLIPMKAKVARELGPLTVYASGGVYGGFGLSGTRVMDVTVSNVTTSTTEDIVWGTDPDNDDMVRIDYGVVGSVGAEFMGVLLEVGYYHGMANLSSYTDDNYVLNNRSFTVSLGYKLAFNKPVE